MKLHKENGGNREEKMKRAGKTDGQQLHLHTTYLPGDLIISGRIGRTVKHTRLIIGFAQQDRLILDHGGRLRFSNGGHRAECRRDQGGQRLIV